MDDIRKKLMELIGQVQDDGCDYTECFSQWDRPKHVDNSVLADHLIANGVTFATDNNVGDKWIPVTERLPDTYRLVLAVCKSGKIFVGEYVDLGWRTLWRIKTARDSTKEITQIVTHWMPLPEPPKEVEHG